MGEDSDLTTKIKELNQPDQSFLKFLCEIGVLADHSDDLSDIRLNIDKPLEITIPFYGSGWNLQEPTWIYKEHKAFKHKANFILTNVPPCENGCGSLPCVKCGIDGFFGWGKDLSWITQRGEVSHDDGNVYSGTLHPHVRYMHGSSQRWEFFKTLIEAMTFEVEAPANSRPTLG